MLQTKSKATREENRRGEKEENRRGEIRREWKRADLLAFVATHRIEQSRAQLIVR